MAKILERSANRAVSTYATRSAWLAEIELSCADLTGGQAPGSTTHRFDIAWLTLSISLRGHCYNYAPSSPRHA